MINRKVNKNDILKALSHIDKYGVPANRKSTIYNLCYNDKFYPPKYVLSIATKIAVGYELHPSVFNGGNETNSFLMKLGFTIKNGSETLQIEKRIERKIKICNALIQIESDNWDRIDYIKKLDLLSEILSQLTQDTDILVLPAGFLNSKNKKPETIFADTERILKNEIRRNNENLFICFGIDGRNKKDQLALSVNRNGIIAIGRKFHHKYSDINLSKSAFELENDKPRYFKIKEKRAYLAVCYDVFGISKFKLVNELYCNFVLGLIHGFGKKGGDSDFARKGLAGTAKQWGVNVYGSAVFSENRNPISWPSGVEWKYGNKSVKDLTYDQIRLKGDTKIATTELATIHLQYYNE